ncbi:MAG: CopG family transcriptional regulator [Proteobacteria bacterium]|nr:CopG family transcriptional regulator [Pseudomonadota bacterium]
MNTNIYLDTKLFNHLEEYIKANNLSRSFLIREALNAWFKQHSKPKWKEGFFDFKPAEDFPLIQELRENLVDPKEDPFI